MKEGTLENVDGTPQFIDGKAETEDFGM